MQYHIRRIDIDPVAADRRRGAWAIAAIVAFGPLVAAPRKHGDAGGCGPKLRTGSGVQGYTDGNWRSRDIASYYGEHFPFRYCEGAEPARGIDLPQAFRSIDRPRN